MSDNTSPFVEVQVSLLWAPLEEWLTRGNIRPGADETEGLGCRSGVGMSLEVPIVAGERVGTHQQPWAAELRISLSTMVAYAGVYGLSGQPSSASELVDTRMSNNKAERVLSSPVPPMAEATGECRR